MHVGNIVQGARMAWAQGRDLGITDEDGDKKVTVKLSYLLFSDVHPLSQKCMCKFFMPATA